MSGISRLVSAIPDFGFLFIVAVDSIDHHSGVDESSEPLEAQKS